jgi:hypothetical protein
MVNSPDDRGSMALGNVASKSTSTGASTQKQNQDQLWGITRYVICCWYNKINLVIVYRRLALIGL